MTKSNSNPITQLKQLKAQMQAQKHAKTERQGKHTGKRKKSLTCEYATIFESGTNQPNV